MIFYTTYFAQLRNLPDDIVPVSICGKAPGWYAGLQYKKLAPKYDFFMEWKRTHDDNMYIRCFNEQVLDMLDPKLVVQELKAIVARTGELRGKSIALVCYERPGDFCHRHLVADWLNKNGIPCCEWEKRHNVYLPEEGGEDNA